MVSGITAGWNQEKRERSYLFIDGGHLRALSRNIFSRIFGAVDGKIDFAAVLSSIPCSKAFYYDCIDEMARDDDAATFSTREKAQRNEFNAIRELAGYHVIEGTLSSKRQKEVDVSLAVDMLTHAFNRNMGWAHLIAGDLDFRPLVQALVRLGIYVTVWSGQTSASSGLRWAADDARTITPAMLHSWCTEGFRSLYQLPQTTIDTGAVSTGIIGEGRYSHGRVTLFQESPEGLFVLRVLAPPQQFRVVHKDKTCLERFFELEHGRIDWK